MGWGGSRPGAGRKPTRPESERKERKRLPSTARTTKAAPPSTRQQLALDFGSIGSAIQLSQQHSRNQRRRDNPQFNPFKLPAFPPQAIPPESSKLQMAMDNAPALDWAATDWAGGYLSDVAAEGLTFLGYNYLSELMQRPEYRTPVETIATEMTRKWIKFTSSGTTDPKADPESESIEATGEVDQERAGAEDKGPIPGQKPKAPSQLGKKPPTDKQDNATTKRIKELTDFLDDLQIRDKFKKMSEGDSAFGRIHLYLDSGASAEEDMTPISEGYTNKFLRGKVGRKWLKRLQVIEPIWTYPTTYNATNPTALDWYNPQVWYVMGKQIHKSRIPVMVGRPVPDLLKPSYAFGGLALTQMLKPYVDIWLTTRQSVGDLIHAFSVMVLSTDIQTILAPGGSGVGGLINRADLFNAFRDNQGLMMINKGSEEFSNVSAPLSGLHELQSQSQEHMLSVTRIPAVKAFGIQPQGLNASSEGEMRAFNDTIKAAQNSLFKPTLDYVIDLAMITLWGKKDPDIVYEFESLVELTDKEEGELKKLKAETGQIHIDTGVIDPAEERKRIIDDSDSDYMGLDPDDVPEPPEDPKAGDDDKPGFDPGKPKPGAQDQALEVSEVRLTTPLLIRLMEFAREDAKDDEDLHVVAEKVIERGPDLLGMKDYDAVMPGKEPDGATDAIIPFAGAKDRLFDNPDLDTAYWIASTMRSAPANVNVTISHGGRAFSVGPGAPPDDDDGAAGEDAEFAEVDHPRAPDGKFGSGGSSASSPAQHVAALKAHAKATTEWLKSKPAVQAMAAAAKSPMAKDALSVGLQSLLSHATGLDASTWKLNEDLVEHIVHEFGAIAQISSDQARSIMRTTIKGLIALRAGGQDAAEPDGITQALRAILDLLGDDDQAEHATPVYAMLEKIKAVKDEAE